MVSLKKGLTDLTNTVGIVEIDELPDVTTRVDTELLLSAASIADEFVVDGWWEVDVYLINPTEQYEDEAPPALFLKHPDNDAGVLLTPRRIDD